MQSSSFGSQDTPSGLIRLIPVGLLAVSPEHCQETNLLALRTKPKRVAPKRTNLQSESKLFRIILPKSDLFLPKCTQLPLSSHYTESLWPLAMGPSFRSPTFSHRRSRHRGHAMRSISSMDTTIDGQEKNLPPCLLSWPGEVSSVHEYARPTMRIEHLWTIEAYAPLPRQNHLASIL